MESKNDLSQSVLDRAGRVRLLLMDCDGVLTDGRLYFTADGEEMKVFNVRDGQGLASWHAAGFESGIVSGRGGREIIMKRAIELGVKYTHTGSKNKVADVLEILGEAGVDKDEVAFMGDDLGDLEAMKLVGFPVAVGDAIGEVRAAAAYITTRKGGRGAIREVTDLLLSLKSR
jgi:3-deoxy-D-manno-octulosonate 8-phosphate phosphatase (KDO 8-P phosphatase)